MSTPTQGSNQFQSQIESVAKQLPAGAQEDFRQLAIGLVANIQKALPGGQFVQAGTAKAGSGTPPAGVQFSVTAANGTYTAAITNPANANGQTIWHEISYSPLKSFTGNPSPTVMPPTAGTSVVIPAPGASYFFRLRSSFDLVNWSSYQLASTTPIASGLQSSAATADAGAFNQTNYGIVTSAAVGATAEIAIQGANGPLTAMTAQKGPTQISQPAAIIAGVTLGSNQFVGYIPGEGYVVSPTLAGVLANDNVRPVGKVSVVGAGPITLPALTPVIQNGYLIGATGTFGTGLSNVPVLTVTDPAGNGAGAVIIGTGVSNGVMTGTQVTKPGNGMYDGNTVITASGGIFPGGQGGGTASGGNGGRMTNV